MKEKFIPKGFEVYRPEPLPIHFTPGVPAEDGWYVVRTISTAYGITQVRRGVLWAYG